MLLCVSLLFWFVVVGSPLVTAVQKKERKKETTNQSLLALLSLRPSRFSSLPYSISSLGRKLGPGASILVLRHLYACLDYHPCIFTWSRTLSHGLNHPSVDPNSSVCDTAKRTKITKQRTCEILPLPQTWATTIKIQSPPRPAVQEPLGRTESHQALHLTH